MESDERMQFCTARSFSDLPGDGLRAFWKRAKRLLRRRILLYDKVFTRTRIPGELT